MRRVAHSEFETTSDDTMEGDRMNYIIHSSHGCPCDSVDCQEYIEASLIRNWTGEVDVYLESTHVVEARELHTFEASLVEDAKGMWIEYPEIVNWIVNMLSMSWNEEAWEQELDQDCEDDDDEDDDEGVSVRLY
jgi:hypothetical protein